jgi:DNA polymerase IV
MRKIIHIDMDAFYASVEQRDYPEYRGKAVAVGGTPQQRGVIATASYEARRYGVRSAMASHRAMQLCPQLILRPARFEVYREVSRQVRAIMADYTDLIEPLSLDEAYLDVTENHKGMPSATLIAQEIRERIRAETGLTASAGVSYNKFLSKVASDIRKPDGLFVITPAAAPAFLETLPIEQFYGIGAKTAPRLKTLGIHTGHDLKNLSPETLSHLFGRSAAFYHGLVRGIDDRPLETDWVRKSVGSECTFSLDLTELDAMRTELAILADELLEWMNRHTTYGRTLTLKVKYADFQQITRSRTVHSALRSSNALCTLAETLLQDTEALTRPVRLLGLSVSKLESDKPLSENENVQIPLREFVDPLQLQLPWKNVG